MSNREEPQNYGLERFRNGLYIWRMNLRVHKNAGSDELSYYQAAMDECSDQRTKIKLTGHSFCSKISEYIRKVGSIPVSRFPPNMSPGSGLCLPFRNYLRRLPTAWQRRWWLHTDRSRQVRIALCSSASAVGNHGNCPISIEAQSIHYTLLLGSSDTSCHGIHQYQDTHQENSNVLLPTFI